TFVLPALVVATTYLSQKLMATPSADPSQASMTRQMNIIMPMMFGLFALQFASGLSIYFIVSNVVGAVQAWLMNRRWQKNPVLVPVAATPTSKASKKIAPPADKPAPSSKASKRIAPPKDNAQDTSGKDKED
ncbi:MAG TPA: YidC/Oxa1 family membrane protein insertase, partial [Anaerolineae bacterium]|nr:YidC/Oxa1 family membrane protein insertase [Anaerolineae bacterium]